MEEKKKQKCAYNKKKKMKLTIKYLSLFYQTSDEKNHDFIDTYVYPIFVG